MTYNFQYSAFRVVIFTAIVRKFYDNFMTGGRVKAMLYH